MLELRWGATPDLRLFALAGLPVHVTRLTAPAEGATDIRLGLVGAGAEVDLPLVHPARLSVRPGLGMLFAYHIFDGAPQPPYRGQSDVVASIGPFVRAGLSMRMADHLSAGVDLLTAIAVSNLVVRFAHQAVAHWGQPIGAALLSAAWAF